MNSTHCAVILAAGKGSRLKSLTQTKPKALMLVAGEPVIYHVIRRLVRQGIRDIAINIHHHAQQLHDNLGNGAKFNAHLYYSDEATLLNSGGGVRTALQLLPDSTSIVVHNADILSHINIQHLAKRCPEDGCALSLVPNPKHNDKGDFSLQQQQVIPTHNKPYTFSGVSVWSKHALEGYAINTNFPLTDPIRKLITQQRCFGTLFRGQWFDIGRHRDLIQANRLFNHEEQ